ncbi:CsoS2 family carboxysome shell protein [Synechococcus lacustris Tous-12m]
MANPSRDLALARREALSRRGKRAESGKDRTRSDVAKQTPPATPVVVPVATPTQAPTTIFSPGAASARPHNQQTPVARASTTQAVPLYWPVGKP